MWGELSLIICSHCRLSSFQLTHSGRGLQSYLCRERTARGRSCQPPSRPNRGSWPLVIRWKWRRSLHLSSSPPTRSIPPAPELIPLCQLLLRFFFHAETFGQLFDQQNFWELFSSSVQLSSRNTKHCLDPSVAFPDLYLSKLNVFGYWLSSLGLWKTYYGLFIFSFLILSQPLKPIPGSSLELRLGLHTILFHQFQAQAKQMNTSASCHNFYTAWYKKQNLYSFLFSSANLQEKFYLI